MRKVKGIRRKRGGWQAYVRVNGVFLSEMFPLSTPISEMQDWRRDQRQLHKTTPLERGTFEADATRYLSRVTAMPSYTDRARHIQLWVDVFRGRRRRTIRPDEIRGVRDAWLLAKYAASTVNLRLRALSNLWTVLDGKRAPNPVREVPEVNEPDAEARGIPYSLVRAILNALPDQGVAAKGEKRPDASKTKARLRVMAWTGLTHIELSALTRKDWDTVAGVLYVRSRRKGTGGAARSIPLTKDGRDALEAFDEVNAWGPFVRSAMHASFRRACMVVANRKKTPAAVKTVLLQLRPYDIRHSYATALYRASGDAHAAATILGHRSKFTTDRYIKAAVPARVAKAVRAFAKASRTG
jgi:integrase